MRATTSCSLQFNSTFGEYALLDEAGELLETGRLRMTKAALWNRFAALAPSVISVNYDPRYVWAVELLTQIGHAIVFSGTVPELMRDELRPVIGKVQGTVLLRQSNPEKTGVFFLVDADGERIMDAHYMLGPVTADMKLGQLVNRIPHSAKPGSAQEDVFRLHQLLATGMMEFPDAAFGFSHALKSNAVVAA